MPYSLYSHRYVLDDVVRLCSHYDEDNDDHVTWDEYSKKTFRVEGLAEMQFKLHVVAHPVMLLYINIVVMVSGHSLC